MPHHKPSKLELYVEILRSLEKLQSSNILSLQEATNIEQAFLRRAMSFLEAQNLVRRESVQNDTFYVTTPRGDRVSRYFAQSTQTGRPNMNPLNRFA